MFASPGLVVEEDVKVLAVLLVLVAEDSGPKLMLEALSASCEIRVSFGVLTTIRHPLSRVPNTGP